MLTDGDIDRDEKQLADYRSADALTEILNKYSTLIGDYKRLKSDYEEERDARERYKQMAREQERNPFVLVLIDGDGYIFNDRLLRDGSSGGNNAAQVLNEAVQASLRVKGLENCQVMIRIYANVVGLSKALFKAGFSGTEKRSYAPFIASFNRSYGLTDFVDAGELKENADFKMRSMLRLYAENTQCKHIYFAGCHDVGYISELTPHKGNHSRFTLIDTPSIRFHDEFSKLGMGVEKLGDVFRSTPLDDVISSRTILANNKAASDEALLKGLIPSNIDNLTKFPCQNTPQGKCKFGKNCKFHPQNKERSNSNGNNHSNGNANGIFTNGNININPNANGNNNANNNNGIKHNPNNNNNNASRPNRKDDNARSNMTSPTLLQQPEKQISTILPSKSDIPEKHVAVNDSNSRLDPYILPPSREVMNRLSARIKKQRLCNSLHLNGCCKDADLCTYNHDPLDAELTVALELIARSIPCPALGRCRYGDCTRGHICQNAQCIYRGGKSPCKLPSYTHRKDLAVARYVPAEIDPLHHQQVLSASDNSVGNGVGNNSKNKNTDTRSTAGESTDFVTLFSASNDSFSGFSDGEDDAATVAAAATATVLSAD